jgi:hypothetical protein
MPTNPITVLILSNPTHAFLLTDAFLLESAAWFGDHPTLETRKVISQKTGFSNNFAFHKRVTTCAAT